MGAVFANTPIQPAFVEVQVLRISFDAPCRYCRRPATTNIKPIDAIGSPMVADLYVCDPHAEQLIARAQKRSLEVSICPPETDTRSRSPSFF